MEQNDSKMTLPSGKLPPDILQSTVLGFSGAMRREVLIGPRVGEDAAVIEWNRNKYMIVTSDPIVGAVNRAGRLLVTVNANDIASKGGDPLYLITTLIFPGDTKTDRLERIMLEIHEACLEMGVAVVGGHTEVNDRYDYPVLGATMIGAGDMVLRAENIKPGDALIATKHIGLEGMSILANDRADLLDGTLTGDEIDEVALWTELISVLPESRILRKWARFMHDPTEGGLIGGIAEILRLTHLGFELDAESLPVHELTTRCAEALGFDPLHLISSGVLLAALPPQKVPGALAKLEKEGIAARQVGVFTEGKGNVPQDATEALWGLLERRQAHD
ncbi:MAG: AIR synthase-related protein [Thermovirgaceae bacterium]